MNRITAIQHSTVIENQKKVQNFVIFCVSFPINKNQKTNIQDADPHIKKLVVWNE